jgi:hypothetical protein
VLTLARQECSCQRSFAPVLPFAVVLTLVVCFIIIIIMVVCLTSYGANNGGHSLACMRGLRAACLLVWHVVCSRC